MKKFYLSLLLIAATIGVAFAQVPKAFNYQAVVRNSSGEVLSNHSVSFKISILKKSSTGSVVYSERHQVKTNSFGLANFEIGSGNTKSGTFSPAGWGLSPHFIKIEFDPAGGSAFSQLATTKLVSVPYAFQAEYVTNDNVNDADHDPSNEIQTLSISGTQLTLSNGGKTVTLPSSGGGDNWGTQTVATDATLTGLGTTAKPLSVVPDGDGDDTNEIQTLSISGTQLTLSNGGKTVTLPSSGGGDNWGTQKVVSNSTLTGDGTTAKPLGVVPDGDGDDTNEIQTISLSGSNLSLSNGGGSVTLPSSSSSVWTESGDNVYRTLGNVGIGTKSPIYEIDIQRTSAILRLKGTTSNAVAVIDRAADSDEATTQYRTGGSLNFYTGLRPNKTAFRITGTTTSYLIGLEVEKDGDVIISKELNTTRNGTANMIPIAYGTIGSDGTIYKSSGNISVSHTTTGEFNITITDEDYKYNKYITTATIIGATPAFISTSSAYNKLNIYTFDKSGTAKDFKFTFVVYKP